jgi:hypothetical protein
MENKKKRIIFLAVLAVVLIAAVILIGYLLSKSGIITPNVEVFGEDDGGPTTIHISLSIPPWVILINSLLIISTDLVILTILDTVKYIKKIEISKLRYKIISVFIFNFLISFLIPTNMSAVSAQIILVVVFILIKNKITKENVKNKEGIT